MGTQFVDGLSVREGLRRALRSPYKETLLTLDQLVDGLSGGVAAAVAFYLDGQPSNNNTLVILNDVNGPETFTFKLVAALPFEVQIGVDADTTMLNLATAIESDSLFWGATRFTNLDAINDGSGSSTAGMVVVILNGSPVSTQNDRIYGVLSTPAFGQLVNFGAEYDYRSETSSQLPAADPTSGQFGFERALADLTPDERHGVLAEDGSYVWDADALEWLSSGGSNSVSELLTVGFNGQTVFLLSQPTTDPAGVTVNVNGAIYTPLTGALTALGTTLTWIPAGSGFALVTTDDMVVTYPIR